VQKSGGFFGFADYQFQVQVVNAYARRNIWFISYEVNEDSGIDKTVVPQIPIPLPNLSLTLSF